MWYPYACFVCDKMTMGTLHAPCVDRHCDHRKNGESPILCPEHWRQFWKLGIIKVTNEGVKVDDFHYEGVEYEFTICPTKGLLMAVKLMGKETLVER